MKAPSTLPGPLRNIVLNVLARLFDSPINLGLCAESRIAEADFETHLDLGSPAQVRIKCLARVLVNQLSERFFETGDFVPQDRRVVDPIQERHPDLIAPGFCGHDQVAFVEFVGGHLLNETPKRIERIAPRFMTVLALDRVDERSIDHHQAKATRSIKALSDQFEHRTRCHELTGARAFAV